MPKQDGVQRPSVVRSITILNSALAAFCLFCGLFLLYLTVTNTGSPVSTSVQCLIVVLLIIGFTYAVVAVEFYRLAPWTYGFVRTMIKGMSSSLFNFWGWTSAIDSNEVRRAFGIKPMKKR